MSEELKDLKCGKILNGAVNGISEQVGLIGLQNFKRHHENLSI